MASAMVAVNILAWHRHGGNTPATEQGETCGACPASFRQPERAPYVVNLA